MKTIEIKIYTFDELSDSAKETARNWYREGGLDYEWWDHIYEDAKTAGLELKTFDLDRNRHAIGNFIESARECAELIIKNHGHECETFKTATAFLKERDEIVDTAPKDENGDLEDESALDDNLDKCEAEFLKSILEDYSRMLQRESEFLYSAESVDENIRANEYTFLQNGKRFA
jgi:hypothetical protein